MISNGGQRRRKNSLETEIDSTDIQTEAEIILAEEVEIMDSNQKQGNVWKEGTFISFRTKRKWKGEED